MKTCFICKKEKLLLDFRRFKSGRNKGYYSSYCNKCRIILQRKYVLKNPWIKTLVSILTRCNNSKHKYYRKGIKNFLNMKDLKELWFRDKAYLLKKASIDRIDNDGHYTKDNCRYIELKVNQSIGGALGGKMNKGKKYKPRRKEVICAGY